ncbi:MAG: Na+/H+ antiporter NhaA [Actinomycetia bacterium]|nr:Na+/H+ antiporter NhaA [Actinomycetes bacterium]MCH9800167.1 Na+/H+ antiporter NhaA [Actinomycetes bacterium]
MAKDPQSEPDSGNGNGGLFGRLSLSERTWTLEALRNETVGGILMLTAAAAALIVANSGLAEWYQKISETVIGPEALHLDLTVSDWAADGLLAIFFFVAGIELKYELQLGSLAKPSKAAVPLAAALGGMILPALLYIGVNVFAEDGRVTGWGIPMATDIAFALAVLAVVGRNLPVALRAFLLSLAVVDDLGAILVIAIFYSDYFNAWEFAASVAFLALYAYLQKRRFVGWPVYFVIVFIAWGFMHASGVHATVAGVAAGLLTRVKKDPGEEKSPGDIAEHRWSPISAGFAVPIFAFFAAGVSLGDESVGEVLASPVALGVIIGLVVGKPIGVVGTAWLMAKFTRAQLSSHIKWRDVLAVGLLAGIGFTVSLLISELAFTDDQTLNAAKLGVLAASLLAAVLATIMLRSRNRYYAQVAAVEEADEDQDGIPDVYQEDRNA